MKISDLMVPAIAIIGLAATPLQPGDAATTRPVKHVLPANTRDWTKLVSPTSAGGFVMGNPEAKVKLIEYGSMTCSHCREFDEIGVPELLSKYVKTGDVSWEFRNYVRDAFDATASLVARCNGAQEFFPLTRGLYAEQERWITKVKETPQDQLQPIHDLPPDQQFVALAKLAGLQDWAAAHGVPIDKSAKCLGDEQSLEELAKMTGDASKNFPDFKGTPAFVINGKMVDLGPITASQVWPTLNSKIRLALSGRR